MNLIRKFMVGRLIGVVTLNISERWIENQADQITPDSPSGNRR
jgi:hypothetical protein